MVYRAGDMSGPMTLNYTLTAGTASAGSDYTGTSGTVQWPNNEGGPREIAIPLPNDSVIEPTEDFTVTFTDPAGLATGLTPAVIHIIDDDDTAAPSSVAFGASNAYVDENAANVTYTVYRLGDSSAALSVPWQTSMCSGTGAATPGQDYTAASGTLSWAAGETGAKTFTIPLLDDTTFEGIESCGASVNPSYPVTAQYTPNASFVIMDNDGTISQPIASLGPGGSVPESAGTLTVPVTLAGLPPGPYPARVDWQIDVNVGTASPNDLGGFSGTLTWLPGDNATKYIDIPITNDSRDETDETFTIYLNRPQYGAQIGSARSATFTITDDDPTPAGQTAPVAPGVAAVAANITVSEGQRTVTVQLRRVGDTTGDLDVAYEAVDGTAGSPDDYVTDNGLLFWAANDTSTKSIEVQINGDAIAESSESFTLEVSPFFNPNPAAKVSIPVTITDDDTPAPPARIAFINASESVSEGATSVTIQVGRTGNSAVAASVDYATTAGTAGAADFTSASGTLSWAANDTANKSITITLLPDTVDESDENFTIALSNASSGAQIDTASIIVTVQDDDAPPPAGPPSSPPGSGGGGGGGGGGGAQDYLSLLLLAGVLAWRRRVAPSLADETARRAA